MLTYSFANAKWPTRVRQHHEGDTEGMVAVCIRRHPSPDSPESNLPAKCTEHTQKLVLYLYQLNIQLNKDKIMEGKFVLA